LARSHDTSRRRTGQLVGFAELGGELVTLRTGRPAHNVELAMIADMASQFVVPGPVVSHRLFDGEEAAVIVGDDEEERLGWRGLSLSGMAGNLPRPQWWPIAFA
jgi:hypothetical protein